MRFLQEEVLENIRGKMLKKKNQKDSWDWNVSTLRRQPEALEKNSDTKRKLSEESPFAGCAKMHLSVLYYAIEKSVDIPTMYKLI